MPQQWKGLYHSQTRYNDKIACGLGQTSQWPSRKNHFRHTRPDVLAMISLRLNCLLFRSWQSFFQTDYRGIVQLLQDLTNLKRYYAWARSPISTAFLERHSGIDRNKKARKARKSYCFSKDLDKHNAMTYFTMYSYNSCWSVRMLSVQDHEDRWLSRTLAMATGLADHVWSLT